MSKVLFVVDVQNDFMEGGALEVPNANEVIPFINKLLASDEYEGIYFSQDWHPKDHCSFKENGGIWPPHCIRFTNGAKIHKGIVISIAKAEDIKFIYKGENKDIEEYSATKEFYLYPKDTEVDFVGLATDYCVKASALDLAKEGYKVNVLLEGCRGVAEETIAEAIKEMLVAGIEVLV